MKKVFVSHPYGGKRHNLQAITDICQRLVKIGVMPVSPVHSFSYLNDHAPEERETALLFCGGLIPLCQEFWLFGEWEKSEGCQREYITAMKHVPDVIPRFVIGWENDLPVFANDNWPEWLKDKRGDRQ